MRDLDYGPATFACVALLLLAIAGCGQPSGQEAETEVAAVAHDGHDHSAEDPHDHSGWWCIEHAIPEEECSMCSAKAAAAFKEKGDWCEEHNRAESQCFKCDPTRAEKYAKLYEAKFGHQPPAATQ